MSGLDSCAIGQSDAESKGRGVNIGKDSLVLRSEKMTRGATVGLGNDGGGGRWVVGRGRVTINYDV